MESMLQYLLTYFATEDTCKHTNKTKRLLNKQDRIKHSCIKTMIIFKLVKESTTPLVSVLFTYSMFDV